MTEYPSIFATLEHPPSPEGQTSAELTHNQVVDKITTWAQATNQRTLDKDLLVDPNNPEAEAIAWNVVDDAYHAITTQSDESASPDLTREDTDTIIQLVAMDKEAFRPTEMNLTQLQEKVDAGYPITPRDIMALDLKTQRERTGYAQQHAVALATRMLNAMSLYKRNPKLMEDHIEHPDKLYDDNGPFWHMDKLNKYQENENIPTQKQDGLVAMLRDLMPEDLDLRDYDKVCDQLNQLLYNETQVPPEASLNDIVRQTHRIAEYKDNGFPSWRTIQATDILPQKLYTSNVLTRLPPS